MLNNCPVLGANADKFYPNVTTIYTAAAAAAPPIQVTLNHRHHPPPPLPLSIVRSRCWELLTTTTVVVVIVNIVDAHVSQRRGHE